MRIPAEKSPFIYTNLSLIPKNRNFVLGQFTPKSFKAWCWTQSPPLCAECGTIFSRPQKPRYFCKPSCQKRWDDRLGSRPYVPVAYRNKDWPGKAAGELPPELQAVRDQWNKELDNGSESSAIIPCGSPMNTYPTNEFPLRPDRRGSLCQLPAGFRTNHAGQGHCAFHGGSTRNSNIKAQRERFLEEARLRSMIYGMPVEQIDPGEAVLQELARTAGHVQWLYEKMQEVEDDYGKDTALEQNTRMGRTPAVWVDLYYRERQHLLSVAKTAASMGIQERHIRLAEEQGRLLADVIRSFMQDPDLGLSPEQMVKAPELMRRHLAAIPMSTKPKPQAPSILLEDGLLAETPRETFIDAEVVDDNFENDPED